MGELVVEVNMFDARAEIARLTAELDTANNQLRAYAKTIADQGRERHRLRRSLEIALDAYEDVNPSDPNIGKPGHFVTQGRKLLDEQSTRGCSVEYCVTPEICLADGCKHPRS